jgi:hypothetical protein
MKYPSVLLLSLWIIGFVLLVSAGCGVKGKYADLSWKETLDKGKEIRGDTSMPSKERFVAAEEAYRIALKKLQNALGKETVKTSDMRELFNELESVLWTQGKETEVEQVLKTKISFYTKHLGKDSMLTGSAHQALGYIYKKSGRNKMAVKEYGEAMRVYKVNKRTSSVTKMQTRIDELKAGQR